VGGAREGWTWIYNPWFRITQLLAPLTVLAEDVFRFPCELNVLEALSVSAVRPASRIPCRNFRRRPSKPVPAEEDEEYAEEHDYDRASQSRSSSERRTKTSGSILSMCGSVAHFDLASLVRQTAPIQERMPE